MDKVSHAVVGDNSDDRLDLLLFELRGQQRFGINVLKVQEIVPCPSLTRLPQAHFAIRGIAHLRERTISVIDLAAALGRRPIDSNDGPLWVIVTEFNRSHQGLLIGRVDRIVECPWRSVLPPPSASGTNSYMSGVTAVDGKLVQILDVERVLAEVTGASNPDLELRDPVSATTCSARVLVVDDSTVARRHTASILDQLNIGYAMARDGREALGVLDRIGLYDADHPQGIAMVIADIEMPELDGYALTKELRQHASWSSLYVLLHTSLNGNVNLERAERCGANSVLTKFVAEELVREILTGLRSQGLIDG